MNRIRTLAQVVGFCTMGFLALYGLLVLSGVAGPLGLAVEADAEMQDAANEAAAVLGATIPQTMNYQGFLREPDGSLTTGSYTITARIYELAAPADGETIFYTTTIPDVTVRDGLFNIVLGDDPPLPAAAFSDAPRYIGIDLNDGAGELIPRQRLHAVPWALTASTLVDDAPAQSVQGLSSTGDVSVTGDLAVTGSVDADGLTISGNKPIIFKTVSGPWTFTWIPWTYVADTGVPSNEYVCGVVGFSAPGGDIDESGGFIEVRAVEDFPWFPNTWAVLHAFPYDDLPNSREVTVLCVDRGMAELQ